MDSCADRTLCQLYLADIILGQIYIVRKMENVVFVLDSAPLIQQAHVQANRNCINETGTANTPCFSSANNGALDFTVF